VVHSVSHLHYFKLLLPYTYTQGVLAISGVGIHFDNSNQHLKTLSIGFGQHVCIIIVSTRGRRHARVGGAGVRNTRIYIIPGPRWAGGLRSQSR
jgi:hypothetical protein